MTRLATKFNVGDRVHAAARFYSKEYFSSDSHISYVYEYRLYPDCTVKAIEIDIMKDDKTGQEKVIIIYVLDIQPTDSIPDSPTRDQTLKLAEWMIYSDLEEARSQVNFQNRLANVVKREFEEKYK